MRNQIINKKAMIIFTIVFLALLSFLLESKNSYASKSVQNVTQSHSSEDVMIDSSTSITLTTEPTTQETTTILESTIPTQNTTQNEMTTESKQTVIAETDFVSNLKIAQSVPQIIVVSANGSTAHITMHDKSASGNWSQIVTTSGFVGKDGVGQTSEYNAKTPVGIYSLTFAFGNATNPGTAFPYTKVDDSYYWIDDVNSQYYNQFVSTNVVIPDWNSAEHIVESPNSYSYVIPINYNTDCRKGAGSAIFLHVSNGSPTLGCVSVPKNDMIAILNTIRQGCVILIDKSENINNY